MAPGAYEIVENGQGNLIWILKALGEWPTPAPPPKFRHSRIQARESKTAERPEGRKQQRRKGLQVG